MRAPLHVIDPKASLVRRGGRIEVRADGKVLASAPLTHLASVVIEGTAGITTPALHALLLADIPVVFMTTRGRVLGRLEPALSHGVELRQRQLRHSLDPVFRLDVARSIVAGKIHNQRVLLAGRARRSVAGSQLDLSAATEALSRLEQIAKSTERVASIVGVEGAASSVYFRAIRRLVPTELGFERRARGAPDILNALINYTSALLRETILAAIAIAGLDPCISFLHNPFRGRPTLAFDLGEEWRPLLVEGTAMALVGLGAVSQRDVTTTPEGPRLSDSARRHTIQRFFQRLGPRQGTGRDEAPGLGGQLRYQVASFARVISGQDPGPYCPFSWR